MMRLTNSKNLMSSVAITALFSVLASNSAFAQSTEPRDRAAEQLDEIVVTARKKEESLQDAPIAISAFSGDALEFRGLTNIEEVSNFVPNLTIQNNPSFSGASNSAAIFIRGVGQAEFLPTTDPGVGLYVDDVYIARSVGAVLDLIEVERVEVLRGPQGTLFGRNTIGGAIALTTKKAGDEFGGRLSATYGTDNRLNLKGSVDIPLAESLSANISAGLFQQDGFVERSDGIELGDDDTLTGRLSFNYDAPSGNFDVDVAFDYTRDRENGPALQLVDIDFSDLSPLQPAFDALNARELAINPNAIPVGPPPPMTFIHNVTAGALAPGQPCVIALPGGPNITSNPAAPNCFDSRFIGADGLDEGTAPAFSESDTWGVSATLKYDLTDEISIKSITAYRELESEFARDGDHSPFRIAEFSDILEQQQFTQELQLLGKSFDNRLDWILGGYYFNEEGDNENILNFTVSNFRSGGRFADENFAVFAQGTYDVTDNLHITLGGRFTDETKSFTPNQVILQNFFAGISNVVPPDNPLAALDAPFLQVGTPILPSVKVETDISEFTPHANISYDLTDDILLYGTYSEGFKSGGFTQRVFPPVIAPFTAAPGTPDEDLIPSFDPEFVEVFELGFKAAILDGKVRLNGAIFDTSYDDLQIQVFTSVAPVTQNAGQASIQGFELELQAAPGDGWFFEGNIAALDAQYDEIDSLSTFVNIDNDFARVPDFSGAFGVSKEFNITGGSSLTPRIDVSYRSSIFNDTFNTPQIASDELTLVDASLTWRQDDDSFSLAGGVKNLTDEEFLDNGVYGVAFQAFEASFDRGRQWYVTVNKRF